jgi:TonB family protein
MLERRIRMITRTTTGRRTLQALALAAVSGLVLALACETPSPTELRAPDANAVTVRDVEQADAFQDCEPAIYVNGEAVERSALQRIAPDGIEVVEVFKGPSAEALAAENVSGAFCGVILVLTKDASVEGADLHRRLKERMVQARDAAVSESPEARDDAALEQAPAFTPMTVRPRLRNADAVREALTENYPPLLKDAGIGGTANVWFFIDDEGRVAKVQINKSSGYDALDAAALRVAGTMEFTPAYNRDVRVPVWVALDITFEASSP